MSVGHAGARALLEITVTGDCMAPVIRSGQRIMVDPSRAAEPGDVVVWRHPETGRAYVKRLAEHGGRLAFVRDDTGERVFAAEPQDAAKLIVGVAVYVEVLR